MQRDHVLWFIVQHPFSQRWYLDNWKIPLPACNLCFSQMLSSVGMVNHIRMTSILPLLLALLRSCLSPSQERDIDSLLVRWEDWVDKERSFGVSTRALLRGQGWRWWYLMDGLVRWKSLKWRWKERSRQYKFIHNIGKITWIYVKLNHWNSTRVEFVRGWMICCCCL